MRWMAGSLVVVAVLALLTPWVRSREENGPGVTVEALNPERFELTVPAGKEVDAIVGDYLLKNSYLAAVIAEPLPTRNANLTTRNVGGCLLDFTTAANGSDQLTAFFPGRGDLAYRSAKVIPATNENPVAAVEVTAPAEGARPEVVTRYALGANDRFLTVTTTFRNVGDKELTVKLEDDFRCDGQKEDMPRSPNGNGPQFWLHDRFWGQAYGIDASGTELQFNSNTRTSTIRYGEGAVTLAPRKEHSFTRRLYAAPNLPTLHSIMDAPATQPVKLAVTDRLGQPLDGAVVHWKRGDNELGTTRLAADGSTSLELAPGDYQCRITLYGHDVEGPFTVAVSKETIEPIQQKIDGLTLGSLALAITDGTGAAIPSKVEVVPVGDKTPVPDFGPETAEYRVRNLIYTPNGKATQLLLPGEYLLRISHGPEYDAIERKVEIAPGKAVEVAQALNRSVNTAGWVSSDFHSHATPSGDNTSSQLGRVLNLVCEHLEFAPCTEHQRITTYDEEIKELGIAAFIATTPGMELTGTPLPLNHQNAFPLHHHPHYQDGGGPTIETDLEAQIEKLALWDGNSEKLMQVNHPDIGWMFYDKNGDGQPDDGFARAFPHIDVLEIHPVEGALDLSPVRADGKDHNTVFNWLQLLNQGFRTYGVVNTDAHYNFHGSGSLRNWIQSSTDDPAKIDTHEMVRASEEGRLVMSNGPFLEVWARAGNRKVTCGKDLPAADGKVALEIRVECPNFLDVDTVTVLVNGRPHPKHHYTRQSTPDQFGAASQPVRFHHTLDLELTSDAHVIVVAGAPTGKLGPFFGPAHQNTPPAAISNPIFIDVDGEGFTPNRDTLDAPLPVKFGAKK